MGARSSAGRVRGARRKAHTRCREVRARTAQPVVALVGHGAAALVGVDRAEGICAWRSRKGASASVLPRRIFTGRAPRGSALLATATDGRVPARTRGAPPARTHSFPAAGASAVGAARSADACAHQCLAAASRHATQRSCTHRRAGLLAKEVEQRRLADVGQADDAHLEVVAHAPVAEKARARERHWRAGARAAPAASHPKRAQPPASSSAAFLGGMAGAGTRRPRAARTRVGAPLLRASSCPYGHLIARAPCGVSVAPCALKHAALRRIMYI